MQLALHLHVKCMFSKLQRNAISFADDDSQQHLDLIA